MTKPSRVRARRAALAVTMATGVLACAACAPAGSTGAAGDDASGEKATLSSGGSGGSGDSGDSEPRIDADPSPGTGGAPTPGAGEPWASAATQACAQALAQAGAEDLAQVAQSPDDHGVVSFWAEAERWAVCDVPSGEEGSVVASGEGARLGPAAFRLRVTDDPAEASRYVAGGPLPWPVHQIGYRFPDGHETTARFARASGEPTDPGWWVVTYTATDGPLAAEGAAPGEPLFVTVTGQAAEGHRIPWQRALRTG